MSERWHPILAAREGPPGVWRMLDTYDHEYGRIELRRVRSDDDTGQVLRYRCEHRGELIGWSTTLRLGCEQVHRAFLAAHGPGMRSAAPDPRDLEQRRNAPS